MGRDRGKAGRTWGYGDANVSAGQQGAAVKDLTRGQQEAQGDGNNRVLLTEAINEILAETPITTSDSMNIPVISLEWYWGIKKKIRAAMEAPCRWCAKGYEVDTVYGRPDLSVHMLDTGEVPCTATPSKHPGSAPPEEHS